MTLLILRTWMIWSSGSIEPRLPVRPDRHPDRRGKSNGCCDRVHAIETLNGACIAGLFPVSVQSLAIVPNPPILGAIGLT